MKVTQEFEAMIGDEVVHDSNIYNYVYTLSNWANEIGYVFTEEMALNVYNCLYYYTSVKDFDSLLNDTIIASLEAWQVVIFGRELDDQELDMIYELNERLEEIRS